jgi:hypothetical protein
MTDIAILAGIGLTIGTLYGALELVWDRWAR